MATPLRVLIVEDSEDDAKLLLRELKRGGYAVTSTRVDTAKDMKAALDKGEWDIVISDHQMPRFDSLAALKLVREKDVDVPFIILSGTIGEDVAVEAMKAGAHDYVMKGQLARLLPAIKRELREAEVRRERRQAEDGEKRRTLDLEFLSRAALEFAAFPPEGDIYQHIAERLRKITGDSIVLVLSFEEESDILECRSVAGLGKLSGAILKLVGRNPGGMRFPMMKELEENLKRGELIKLSMGMYELAQRQIPKKACGAISKLIGLGDIYALGIARGGKLFAHASILTRTGAELGGKTTIETFANQASVALQRRRAEEGLRVSEERYRSMVESISNLVQSVEPDGSIIFVNRAWRETLGYSEEEVRELSIFDVVHPESQEHCMDAFQRVLAGERVEGIEARFGAKDGRAVAVEGSASCHFEDGRPVRTYGIFHDVTDRKQTEKALRELAERFRAIFDAATDGILLADAETKRFEIANETLCEMTGYTQNEITDMGVEDIHPREDLPHVVEQFEQQKRGEQPLAENIPVRRKDGTVFYADINSSLVTLRGKKYLLGIFRDITERRRAEEALRESENSLAEAQRIARLGNWDWNIETDALFWSDEIYRIFGLTPREFGATYEAFLSAVHPDDRKFVETSVDEAVYKGKPYSIDHRIVLPGGEARHIHEHGKVFRDASGKPVRMVGTVQDITERKQAEEAIEILARLPRENPSPVLRVSLKNEILYANPASAMLLRHWDRRVGDPVPAELGALISAARSSGKSRTIDVEASDRLFSFVCAPVAGTGYVNLYGRDITEHRKIESQLRQAQKMEAVGQLAGGIAHDFNNLLTGILGYANMLRSDSKLDKEVHESAKVIEKAARRAAELTKQLLGFARKGKLEETSVDVHRLVQEVASILGHTIDRRIRISQKLGAKPPYVRGDASQLQQVLLNLGVNARDAMPEGGEIVFETFVVELDEEYCRAHAGASPGRHLLISVTDTGCGIPKEIQDRIFEPYFTTKKRGEGTGMGLAMVYGIVKNHGGSIRVYSEGGRGTTFKVYLPLALKSAPLSGPLQAVPRSVGTGRILVVEDEEVIRTMATKMLEGLGYEVVTAADGQEGVEYYEKHQGEIDLVIIDMVMPRMNGRDCFRRLKAMNPAVRAILSTGYGRNGAVQELLGEGIIGYVQKPYVVGQLAEAVAKALKG